jgi:amino acid adenylation domain-containing protein
MIQSFFKNKTVYTMDIAELIKTVEDYKYSLKIDGEKLILKPNKNRDDGEVYDIKNNKEVIEYIKANKEQIIEFLKLSGKKDLNQEQNTMSSIYRLSFLQTGMLFHDLYDEQAGAYRNQLKCDLLSLDEHAFYESWQYLIRQHSILRSSFNHDAFKMPVQCVHRNVKMPIELLDFRHLAEADQQLAVSSYERQDHRRGFDLSQAPLMRVVLLRLKDDHYRMLWTSHHILLDGWSIPVLMEEFLNTYDALVKGKTPEPYPEDQYEEYIRYLDQRDKEEEERYWRSSLRNIKHTTFLPFIRGSSLGTKGVEDFQQKILSLNEDITRKIDQYIKRQHITANTLMQGVWAYLLHGYTNLPDISYGIVTSGRPADLMGVEKKVGLFINTLPLCSFMPEKGKVSTWLKDLQKGQLESMKFQYVSLSDIQRWSGIQGDLFDSIMVFQNYPLSKIVSSNDWLLKVLNIETLEQTSNYPLLIRFSIDKTITCQFIYKESQLPLMYVEKIKQHFEHILLQIIDNDDWELGDLRLVNSSEEDELLYGFNHTGVSYGGPESLTGLFEAQALLRPDDIALVYAGLSLSYGELELRSNQLGHYLRSQGVGREVLVPICVERGLEMMIGILGILKAGGAYVPIDPEYPEERIAYMLSDLGAGIVLTSSKSSAVISSAGAYSQVILDSDWPVIGTKASSRPDCYPGGADAAYVIYTSGSTGRPKGVVVEHGNIVNFIKHETLALGIETGEHILLFANYTFDASVEQIFIAFHSGSRLVILPDAVRLDKHLFEYFLADHQITHLHATPSYLSTVTPGKYGSLKRVLSGGEVCKTVLEHQWSKYCDFYNTYGPTEAAVTVLSYQSPLPGEVVHPDHVPIGKPVSNTQIYILNSAGSPVPVGVPGELYIGGVQVARGYLNLPELTSKKFVPDRFGKTAGGRLYRTGDVGRWLSDGNIEFMGRADDQVKIRGYRVELGEVESVLQQAPGVTQCVVVSSEEVSGNLRLVGYVVGPGSADRDALQGYLRSRLPDYMVPGILVSLEKLPLTSNGKIDKRSLPLPDVSGQLLSPYEAPRTELERSLVLIWQELLGVARVGIHDNFFELGGHSLLVIQLLHYLKNDDVLLKVFFTYPTIRDLATYIEQKRKNYGPFDKPQTETDHLLLLRSGDSSKGIVFILPGAGGVCERYQELASLIKTDDQVYGIQMMGAFKGEKPLQTLEEIAAQNIRWLKLAQPGGPYKLIGHSFGSYVAYEMARQLEIEGERIDFISLMDVEANTRIKFRSSQSEKNELIVRVAAAIFERYGLIQEPYPSWVKDLEKRLMEKESIEDMRIHLGAFAEKQFQSKKVEIDIILQTFELLAYNAIVSRQIIPAKLKADMMLIKGADENWSDFEDDLGWGAYFENVRVITVPGNHEDLIEKGIDLIGQSYTNGLINRKLSVNDRIGNIVQDI